MKQINKAIDGLKYSFYILSHPVEGFYDMRFENKGNLLSSFILILLLIFSFIFQKQYTGFIFNVSNLKYFNVLREISNVVIPVVLWCTANWSITVLMDGEGRFVDIFKTTCYATVPFIIANYLTVFISLWATGNEQTFLVMISNIGLFWTAFLLFFGIMTIHQFSVIKTVVSIILTIIGMGFIIFLVVLLASIIDKLFGYLSGIVNEIRFRI